jgi:hypothetical protein
MKQIEHAKAARAMQMSQIAQLQHDVKGIFKRIECKNRAANKEKKKQNGVFCIKILQE